jgi:arabinosyltransferase
MKPFLACRLAKRGMQHPAADTPLGKKRLFLGNNGNLVVGILPTSIFASGHTFFVSRTFEQLDLQPYVVHATFQFSGTPGKRNRMREFMLWNDEPEYYQPGHGFVTWVMDTPEEMVQAAVPNLPSLQCCDAQKGHFDLMNHQLLQTRNAFAAASVRPYSHACVNMHATTSARHAGDEQS